MRLNLGAGSRPLDGYVNLDGSYAANSETIYPLSYSEVKEIRASHVLEHFGTEESIQVLLNWIDCLAPGGILKIAVPDFDDLMRRRALGQELNYEGIIMGGQTDERDFHKSLWTTEKLAFLMMEMGLIDIRTWQSEIMDCASLPFSLNLQGVKP